MSPRILCPTWFAIVQGTNFQIDPGFDIEKKKLVLISGDKNTEIQIEKTAEGPWQINCLKNQKLIHQIGLSELELAAAFAWTNNYLECSDEFNKKFTPWAAVQGKFIRDKLFLNLPFPNEHSPEPEKKPKKENFSLLLNSSIRSIIRIMLDSK